MKPQMPLSLGLMFPLLLFLPQNISAQEIVAAVASNFQDTLAKIIRIYEEENPDRVTMVVGSTGSLFSQINNGAPFDVFFAADQERPRLLVQSGLADEATLQPYALGKLVFVVREDFHNQTMLSWLGSHPNSRIVLANPKTAPYGTAAQSALQRLGFWESLQPNLVFAGNVNKVLHILETGNAQCGFSALSSVLSLEITTFWNVPENLFPPIVQDRVILNTSRNKASVERFLRFLDTKKAMDLLDQAGYTCPERTL